MRIGFIGLGNMGSGMAANLASAGHQVLAYNRSPDKVSALAERGAIPAATVAAACDADVVITMLADDHAVEAVLSIFAPRNLGEFARVLTADGRLLVLAPNPGHLAVLRERFGLLAIEPGKQERLLAAASEFFEVTATSRLRTPVALSAGQAADVIAMGPNAFHHPPLPNGPVADHLDVTLRVFRPLPGTVDLSSD